MHALRCCKQGCEGADLAHMKNSKERVKSTDYVNSTRLILQYRTFAKKGPLWNIPPPPPPPPPPHFGLNFMLRSNVYSNMRPYVAALEHACALTIKWAWLRSIAVHDRSFEAETRHKFYGCLAGYFSIVPRLFGVQSS